MVRHLIWIAFFSLWFIMFEYTYDFDYIELGFFHSSFCCLLCVYMCEWMEFFEKLPCGWKYRLYVLFTYLHFAYILQRTWIPDGICCYVVRTQLNCFVLGWLATIKYQSKHEVLEFLHVETATQWKDVSIWIGLNSTLAHYLVYTVDYVIVARAVFITMWHNRLLEPDCCCDLFQHLPLAMMWARAVAVADVHSAQGGLNVKHIEIANFLLPHFVQEKITKKKSRINAHTRIAYGQTREQQQQLQREDKKPHRIKLFGNFVWCDFNIKRKVDEDDD